MNSKIFKILEWEKITAMISGKCATPLGKKAAEDLSPITDISELKKAGDMLQSALDRMRLFGPIRMGAVPDVRESLLRLSLKANLSMSELYAINVLLRTAFHIREYGNKSEFEDALTETFSAITPLVSFQKDLDRTFLSEEEMADDASPALASVRRKIRQAESKIHSELNDIVVSNGSYLRDHVITMRDGRYCIPVKTEFRSQVPGMIHDESGSGSTVFVEPLRIVKLNNEIRLREIEEEKEILKILAELSAVAETYRIELSENVKRLSELDFLFAKASVAVDMKGNRPEISENGSLLLKNARHPLLNTPNVVPITVSLGETFDTLIITGPNTGGKTVSLKTIGLMTLMGMSGLWIPADEGSVISVFSEVFADIGDEQSIEQNLSTFSSHMKSIIAILKKADEKSLILLDELCAGTDPEEGAALAIAILNALRAKGSVIAATTHYSELKLYALSEAGVENASSEFDVGSLRPTYRLLIGIPGKSNAFAISKRLGLPQNIIDDAASGIDTHKASFEDVIRDLNNSQRKMEKEKSKIGVLKSEAKRLRESLESEEAKLEEKRKQILDKAREEAAKMLSDAKAQVDETIRVLNKHGGDVKELEKQRTKTRELLEKAGGDDSPAVIRKSKTKADELSVGTPVTVLSVNSDGNVSALPDSNGLLQVQIGILSLRVPVSDVVIREENTKETGSKNKNTSSQKSSGSFSKAMTISPEVNLIGMTVDEAMPVLDKYLDDAYLSHLPSVRVIHGRGTGALKNAVHEMCRRSSYIKTFRLGEFGEGDSGVTVITFR